MAKLLIPIERITLLLSTMLADMENAPQRYKPTRFWAGCVPHILDDIAKHGVTSFRSHQSGLNYYVPSYAQTNYMAAREEYDRELDRLAEANLELAELWRRQITGAAEAEMDYHIFVAAETDKPPELLGVSQSDFGAPSEFFQFHGKVFGAAFLRYLKCLVFLKKHTPSHRIRRVLEIGGGYGVLGEILLKSPSRPYFYVNVDIPPVAYVATEYLRGVFGKEAVADYLVTRDLETIDPVALQQQGYRAVVLCPWQLERLQGPFELFVNSASFQEMEPEVVANYASHVTRLVNGYLLLKNSRHGKQLAEHEGAIGVEKPTTHAHYLDFFSEFELVARDVATFGLAHGGFASEVLVFKRGKG